MSEHWILTAIGDDRPGLVDEVSRFIFERGGNIEDSRMVNLRGQFAIMVLVAGGEGAMQRVREEREQLSIATGLHCELHPARAESTRAPQAMAYRLTATTIDQPGLVHRLSHLLRNQDVNIESLETHLRPAPVTGSPLFEMEFILSVPKSTAIRTLRDELARVCEDLNVDHQLTPVAGAVG